MRTLVTHFRAGSITSANGEIGRVIPARIADAPRKIGTSPAKGRAKGGENRLGKVPRRATNRGRNRARLSCRHTHTHTQPKRGYESFFREESFEYSILVGERERDGRLRARGAISFLLFRPLLRVLFVGREDDPRGEGGGVEEAVAGTDQIRIKD